eukprot:750088-Hanusia_phi.AAC.1
MSPAGTGAPAIGWHRAPAGVNPLPPTPVTTRPLLHLTPLVGTPPLILKSLRPGQIEPCCSYAESEGCSEMRQGRGREGMRGEDSWTDRRRDETRVVFMMERAIPRVDG